MCFELSDAEKEFEKLESTKKGRRAERIVRDYFKFILGFEITQDIRPGYDTSKDMSVSKDGRSYNIEIKLDDYGIETGNLPLEYKQTNKQGGLDDSFILTSTADYAAMYCRRRDTAYLLCLNSIRWYVNSNTIQYFRSEKCNKESDTGYTLCYLTPIEFLIDDQVIVKSYEGVVESLNLQGFEY